MAGRRPKTDREDAQNIAELLADGRLPLAYAPPLEVQILRDWSRQRNRLSRTHARALHGVKSIMNGNNTTAAQWQTFWLIPLLFAVVVTLMFAFGFKEKVQVRKY